MGKEKPKESSFNSRWCCPRNRCVSYRPLNIMVTII
jgi:hypothetical protein